MNIQKDKEAINPHSASEACEERVKHIMHHFRNDAQVQSAIDVGDWIGKIEASIKMWEEACLVPYDRPFAIVITKPRPL